MASNGFSISNNFGQFANTSAGVLALTLFYEQTTGTTALYDAMAQVMINRYEVDSVDPELARQLHLPDFLTTPGTSYFSSIVEQSSGVWVNGSLRPETEDNLIAMMNGSVVGAANAVNKAACNQFVSAASVAKVAANSLSSPFQFYTGVSSNTYWFYIQGTSNPVSTKYWNTTFQTISAVGTNWTFETYVSAVQVKRPPIRKR